MYKAIDRLGRAKERLPLALPRTQTTFGPLGHSPLGQLLVVGHERAPHQVVDEFYLADDGLQGLSLGAAHDLHSPHVVDVADAVLRGAANDAISQEVLLTETGLGLARTDNQPASQPASVSYACLVASYDTPPQSPHTGKKCFQS